MTGARVVLLLWAPGLGQDDHRPAARGRDGRRAVLSRRVDDRARHRPLRRTARAKVEALQWELAQELLALGQTVIIEWGVWCRVRSDMVRERPGQLRAQVELVYLDVPVTCSWNGSTSATERPHGTVVITRENLLSWVDFFGAERRGRALFDE